MKKILWLAWKDCKNPAAGGAEIVNSQLAKRLVNDGFKVIFLVASFKGAPLSEERDGYKIIRLGNRWTVYLKVWRYYRRHLKGWPDLVVDEINTIPFFSKFYVAERSILFVHQLCRTVWFYQMAFPFNLIGYLLEPIYLRMLNKSKVITVSLSTKKDLVKYGFAPENISIISEGIDNQPLSSLNEKNSSEPLVLNFGSIRRMKRTNHIIKAFESAKKMIPELRLIIAGRPVGRFGNKIKLMISDSIYADSIKLIESVSPVEKMNLMANAHVLISTSVKEGWGLVVTEANSMGTPAIVYDVDGLRDSVKNEKTGFVVRNKQPDELAKAITWLLSDKNKYENLRKAAWQWSKEINFDKSHEDFLKALNL